MPDYVVEWRIDITADTPVEAARKALEIQREPGSISTVFTVMGEGDSHKVDLTAVDEDDACKTCGTPYDGAGDGWDGNCPECADKAEEKGAEIAARAAGWLHGGDGDGIIYHGDHYDSWKEAVSYSGGEGYEDAPIYSTWQECCDFEGIEYEPAGDDA